MDYAALWVLACAAKLNVYGKIMDKPNDYDHPKKIL